MIEKRSLACGCKGFLKESRYETNPRLIIKGLPPVGAAVNDLKLDTLAHSDVLVLTV